MGQKLQDGKKVLEMSQLHPHSKTRPVQTIHPTDLGLLPSWNSIVGPPAQEFSPSWTARKRMQERVEISWKSRKSELVKLQYNPNVYKWGISGCPESYCYINLYPMGYPLMARGLYDTFPWPPETFPGYIRWFPGPFLIEILVFYTDLFILFWVSRVLLCIIVIMVIMW